MSAIHETSDSGAGPETVTFGRTLVDGEPIDEGLTLPADSPTVELLREASGPLCSNPVAGEYGAVIVAPEAVDGAYVRGLLITPPGALGPPKHYHRDFAEIFEVVEGELVVTMGDEKRTVRAGESVTIEAGTPHAFGNESESYASFLAEARPASRVLDLVQSLFGLAHDGKLKESAQPRFLQAMVIAEEFGDDTVFVSPPPAVQRVLAALLGPIGRIAGYQGFYPEYAEDSFWEERVEQLPGR